MLMKEIEKTLVDEAVEERIEFAKDFLTMKNEEIEGFRDLLDRIESFLVDLEDEYESILKMSVSEVYARYSDKEIPVTVNIVFE